MNILVSLILAGALIMGGGVTAVAAQDDLPNQPLYPVKLMTENVTLALTGDPQQQANQLMNMAQTRTQEMAALVEDGIPVPAQVQERLREQIQQTLMLAADMDDPALSQTLLQLREQLQTQERLMTQLQTHANEETEPLLTRTRQMIQNQLRLVEQGIADPQQFRHTMRNQMRHSQEGTSTPEPDGQGGPNGPQNCPGECTPNPQATGTPQNMNKPGPGGGSVGPDGNGEPGGPGGNCGSECSGGNGNTEGSGGSGGGGNTEGSGGNGESGGSGENGGSGGSGGGGGNK